MRSENPSGADNQQETATESMLLLDPSWVVGFVDGEGCFCVSIHRNPMVRSTGGWQLHPVFQVSQHEEYQGVLEDLVSFFGCGRVRGKGPRSTVMVYAVDRLHDLEEIILPFFEQHPLRVKSADFETFASLVRMISRREHLTPAGFEKAVRAAYGMNARGKQRARSIDEVLAGSSETVRQALFN